MEKLSVLTNERLLSLGEEQGITICGSQESILWDGDLEEVLASLKISFSGIFYKKDPVFGDSSELINCEEGEHIGYVLFVQKSKKALIPIIASSIGCSEMNEQLNFNNIIKGGK